MSHAFRTSGFADEISPDLDVQLSTLKRLGVGGIDVRGLDGLNVLQLSPGRLSELRGAAEAQGIVIQCVGSPVNKVPVTAENRKNELRKLEQSVEAAKVLGTKRIRIFTPETGAGDDDEANWPEVRSWMKDMVDMAQANDLILIHENDARFFGAYPNNCRRLLEEFSGPNFRAIFDFSNAVLIGYRPFPHWFPWVLPYLDTLHIKDSVEATGAIVPSGEGDGQMAETIRWLIGQGWQGTLTLEPHLSAKGPFGGFSGPQLFETAVTALRKTVAEAGGEC